MRAFSELSPMTPRFPVLRFFGICREGDSLSRPRASASCRVSSPVIEFAARCSQHKSRRFFFACRVTEQSAAQNEATDSPLSGFPPYIPSIIGRNRGLKKAERKLDEKRCGFPLAGRKHLIGEVVEWAICWREQREIGWWGSRGLLCSGGPAQRKSHGAIPGLSSRPKAKQSKGDGSTELPQVWKNKI